MIPSRKPYYTDIRCRKDAEAWATTANAGPLPPKRGGDAVCSYAVPNSQGYFIRYTRLDDGRIKIEYWDDKPGTAAERISAALTKVHAAYVAYVMAGGNPRSV